MPIKPNRDGSVWAVRVRLDAAPAEPLGAPGEILAVYRNKAHAASRARYPRCELVPMVLVDIPTADALKRLLEADPDWTRAVLEKAPPRDGKARP